MHADEPAVGGRALEEAAARVSRPQAVVVDGELRVGLATLHRTLDGAGQMRPPGLLQSAGLCHFVAVGRRSEFGILPPGRGLTSPTKTVRALGRLLSTMMA